MVHMLSSWDSPQRSSPFLFCGKKYITNFILTISKMFYSSGTSRSPLHSVSNQRSLSQAERTETFIGAWQGNLWLIVETTPAISPEMIQTMVCEKIWTSPQKALNDGEGSQWPHLCPKRKRLKVGRSNWTENKALLCKNGSEFLKGRFSDNKG